MLVLLHNLLTNDLVMYENWVSFDFKKNSPQSPLDFQIHRKQKQGVEKGHF